MSSRAVRGLLASALVAVLLAVTSPPATAVSGGTISGTVTIPEGVTGQIGVAVYQHNPSYPSGQGTEAGDYAVESDGHYTLDLPAGVYTLVFYSRGTTVTLGHVYYGDTEADGDDSTRLFVTDGSRTTVDVTMKVPEEYARVSGRVTDRSGNPLPLSRVIFSRPATADDPPGDEVVSVGGAQTDANGQFLTYMEPGSFQVTASSSGYVSTRRGFADAADPRPVELPAKGTVNSVDFALTGLPPVNTTRGGIGGRPERVGQESRVSPGEWSKYADGYFSPAVGLSYTWQWFVVDATGERAIPGATSSRYTSGLADLGKAFRVVMTASMSGSAPVTAFTDLSPIVKRAPKIAITSVTSPRKKTVKLTIQVKASPGGVVTGKVDARCTFTYRGSGTSRKVSLKNGKATLTIKAGHRLSSKSKYGRCAAAYYGDGSTLAGETDINQGKRFRLKLK